MWFCVLLYFVGAAFTCTHASHDIISLCHIFHCVIQIKMMNLNVWEKIEDRVWGREREREEPENQSAFALSLRRRRRRRRRTEREEKRQWNVECVDWVTKLAMAQMNRLNENDFDLFSVAKQQPSRSPAHLPGVRLHSSILMDKLLAATNVAAVCCELETN